MIIKYMCECCDRIVEEVIVSEDLLNFLDEDEGNGTPLTGLMSKDIMNLELQGSLVLQSMCPECLAELNLEERLDFGTPIIN